MRPGTAVRRPAVPIVVSVVPLALPWLVVAAVVLVQIRYAAADDAGRSRLVPFVVVPLAVAWALDALRARGRRAAAGLVAATVAPALAIEIVGVRTGVPFGRYAYDPTLGATVGGVPWIVPLAWLMIAYPAACAARRLAAGFAGRVLVGAWATAAMDLFLDPQMTHDRRWRFADPTPHLPGVAAVPLSNAVGWLLASLVISLLLQTVLARSRDTDDRLPVWFYLWLYVGWVVSLAGFLGLPAAAAWGALGAGAIALPLGLVLWRGR